MRTLVTRGISNACMKLLPKFSPAQLLKKVVHLGCNWGLGGQGEQGFKQG